MKVDAVQGEWQRGRWRQQLTLVRRHKNADGPLTGVDIPWCWLDGMYPVTVTIEGNFVGNVRIITSARRVVLPGEAGSSDPSALGEGGNFFPYIGQEITRPAILFIANPVGWLGVYLANAIAGAGADTTEEAPTEGELSVFVFGSSMANGG